MSKLLAVGFSGVMVDEKEEDVKGAGVGVTAEVSVTGGLP